MSFSVIIAPQQKTYDIMNERLARVLARKMAVYHTRGSQFNLR